MKRESKCYMRKNWLYSLHYGIVLQLYLLASFLGMSGKIEQNAYAKTTSNASLKKVQIKKGEEWCYFKGKKKPPKEWKNSGFDDSSWQKGNSGFGYGHEQNNDKNNKNETNLGDMKGNYSTVYVRKDFIIDDAHEVTNMILSVDCDGPFIAYLNGIEIIRNVYGLQDEQFDISGFIHELFPGENILAVEGNNDDINSDEFTFLPCFEITERQGR